MFDTETPFSNSEATPVVIAVGGGKGGVGKSLISSNLGISLTSLGYKVVLVDMDLECPNLHTFLGIDHIDHTLASFIGSKNSTLSDHIVSTKFPSLGLLSSHVDHVSPFTLKYADRQRINRDIGRLPVDFVILDMGAGTSPHTLDFFLTAHLGLVVVLPEPTSVENLYRFIKAVTYRRIKRWQSTVNTSVVLNNVITPSKDGSHIATPLELIREVRANHPNLAKKMEEHLRAWPFHLIVNGVHTAAEAKLGEHMEQACAQFLGVLLFHIGTIPYDDAVWQAVRLRQAVVTSESSSPAAQAIRQIAKRLVG
jgi:flagellar biosynthesis protein FlhG